MIRDDDDFLSIIDEFQAAAVGGDWVPALDALAAATGSRAGELIVIDASSNLPLHVMTNMPDNLDALVDEHRIGDPEINPRVKAGMQAPVLKVLAESDFITPEEHRNNAHYQAFAFPLDIPYICLATLDRTAELLIGLAVLRTEQQGHVSQAQRQCFGAIAPHVRAAVRTQMHLRGQGLALLKGTLESLSIAAFVCDASGHVSNLTPAAEALVTAGTGLGLRQGKLTGIHDADTQAIEHAIRTVSGRRRDVRAPAQHTIVVRGADAADEAIVLDVVALPARGLDLVSGPSALIVARGRRGSDSQKAAILQGVYGLTAAETDIALQLAAGRSVADIAGARRVSTGTVRLQVKSLLAKVGVRRQAELVARIGQL